MSERRLLIVEDDEVFARTLARSFERRGYQVRAITDPEELDAAAAELIACASGRPLDQIGRLRAQAPIKPLPFGVELAP